MKSFIFLSSFIFSLSLHQAFSVTETEAFQMYVSIYHLPTKKKFLNETERQRLFQKIHFHKVAALNKLPQYDPTGEIGFCFGRAMAVHLMAKKMGLENDSIRKLFVIGDLRQGEEPEWRFHVTTLVKGDDGEWWAVDPIMVPPLAWSGTLPMKEWMQIIQETWDKKKKAHFYLVDASTIIPDLRTVPEPSQETGEKVIEKSFNPKKAQEGFDEKILEEFIYSEVSPKAQYHYFTHAFEEDPKERFQYLGISINEKPFDYRHYFVDLLTDLRSEFPIRAHGLNTPLESLELYSPKVQSWFR